MDALDTQLFCSAQVSEAILAKAAQEGVGLVICNRPDGEEPGQPDFATVKQWAAQHGMNAVHIPVVPGQFTPAAAAAFAQAVNGCDKKVLAYCRTGMRAAVLWGAKEVAAQHLSPAEAVDKIAAIGRDASGALPFLQAQA